MKRFNLTALFGILFSVLFLIWYNLPGPRFLRSFEALRIGMTKEQVQKVFENRSPSQKWKYFEFSIWYFERINNSSYSPSEAIDEISISSLKDLPDKYAAVQIAFDKSGKVWAYTWIGEAYSVFYGDGKVNGSNLVLIEAAMQEHH